MLNELELSLLQSQLAHLLGVPRKSVDISVEDECVVLETAHVRELVERVRSRDFLVAELVTLFITALPDSVFPEDGTLLPDGNTNARAFRENLAERVIAKLGTSVLVSGSPADTSGIVVSRDEMSRDEFERREGVRRKRAPMSPAQIHAIRSLPHDDAGTAQPGATMNEQDNG